MTIKDAVQELQYIKDSLVSCELSYEALDMAIRSLETENVRCRDCRWNYIHVTPNGNEYHLCKFLNLAFDNGDDFFCAYGEKKIESGEPIPQWRGCYDGTIPYFDGKEVEE